MAGTPPSADAVAVFGLLSIIADPAAAKARMVELEQIRASAAEAQEKHRLTLLELRQTTEVKANWLAAGDKALDERKAALDNQQATATNAAAVLKAAEQDLHQRRGQFNQRCVEVEQAQFERAAALNTREQELNKRDDNLKAREENLKDRGAKVASILDEANAIKADYERKSAALQKALK